MTANFRREEISDCDELLFNYAFINESTAIVSPFTSNIWEVRNSSGNLLLTKEASKSVNFYYAFPYLDTFTVKLTTIDTGLNIESHTETYVFDECPECSGGGGPSVPEMAERYDEPEKIVRVKKISSADSNECFEKIKLRKYRTKNK